MHVLERRPSSKLLNIRCRKEREEGNKYERMEVESRNILNKLKEEVITLLPRLLPGAAPSDKDPSSGELPAVRLINTTLIVCLYVYIIYVQTYHS